MPRMGLLTHPFSPSSSEQALLLSIFILSHSPSYYHHIGINAMSYVSGSTDTVTAVEEYVIGPDNIPFFTTKVCPSRVLMYWNGS